MSAVKKYSQTAAVSADRTPAFLKRWPLLSGAPALLHDGVKLRSGATKLYRNGPALYSGAAFLYRNVLPWSSAAAPESSGRAHLRSVGAMLHSAGAALSHVGANLLHATTKRSNATTKRSTGTPFHEGRNAFSSESALSPKQLTQKERKTSCHTQKQ